jgi:excisionase family DNA binding protein
MTDPGPRLYTIVETADRLAVSRRTVERHIACGRLRAVRPGPGAHWRVTADDLARFVAAFDDNQPTYRRLRQAG